MECSSADAMFLDVRAAQGNGQVAFASAGSPAAPRTYQFDGGKMEFDTAGDILSLDDNVTVPAGSLHATTVKVDDSGCRCEGPGGEEGSGLRLRESLGDVLVVIIAMSAYRSLKEHFESSELKFHAVAQPKALRRKYERSTYAAMRNLV